MNKLYILPALLLLAFQLHANGEEANDFCTAEEPCEEEAVRPTCLYCPSYYYFYGDEDFDTETSWPGRRSDDFIESLIR